LEGLWLTWGLGLSWDNSYPDFKENSKENCYELNCTNFWKILFPGVFNAKGKEICFKYSS